MGGILTLLTGGTGFRALYKQEEHSGWYTYNNTWRNFVQTAALQGRIYIHTPPGRIYPECRPVGRDTRSVGL